MIADLVQAGHGRQYGSGARRQHDPVGRDHLVADRQLLGGHEAPGDRVDGYVGQSFPVVTARLCDRVDPSEDAVPDGGPVGAVEAGVNAQPLAGGRQLGDLGRVDEHLGGNAAHVQTGPAERAVFHHGDVPIVVFGPDHRISRAGAYYQQVETAHLDLIFCE